MTIRVPINAVLATLLAASPALAQEAELTLSGGRVLDEQGAERSGLTVAPAFGWTDGLNAVALRGSATLLDGGEPLFGVGLSTRLQLIQAGPASLELVSGGEMLASQGWRGGAGRTSPRVAVSGLTWSASAGPVWGVAAERTPREVTDGGLFQERSIVYDTETHGFSGLSVNGRVSQGVGSIGAEYSQVRGRGLEWEDLGMAGSVVVDGVVLGASIGARLGGDRAEWGGASVAIPLGPSALVLVEGGRFPTDLLLDRAGGRYLTVGLRMRDLLSSR